MNGHLNDDQRSALVLGIADAGEAAEWMAHVEGCADCRAALEADRALLGRLGEADPPEPSRERWDAALRAAIDETRPAPARPVMAFDHRPRMWMARAAVLFVVFCVGFHAGSNRQPAPWSLPVSGAGLTNEEPVTPASYRPAAPAADAITTASIKSRYLMVRAEDSSRV